MTSGPACVTGGGSAQLAVVPLLRHRWSRRLIGRGTTGFYSWASVIWTQVFLWSAAGDAWKPLLEERSIIDSGRSEGMDGRVMNLS